jgi:2-methylcitrate dehydratase PrpD
MPASVSRITAARKGSADDAFARFAAAGPSPSRAELDAAALLLADLVGVALAGTQEESFAALASVAGRGAEQGPARVLGTDLRLAPAQAALLNGFAGHLLDFDDDETEGAMAHLSVTALAAALAVADSRAAGRIPPSGAEVLTAYIAAFRFGCALGREVNPALYKAGWHATSVLGAPVAATAAGRLLGFDAERMRHAVGLAAASASGMRAAFGSDAKPLQVARATEAGVLAAQLVAAGLKAAPDMLFGRCGFAELYSGGPVSPVARPVATAFPPESLTVKVYPCCTAMHAAVAAVLDLRRRHPFAAAELAAIHCRIDPFALRILTSPDPATPQEARFSLPFGLAAAAACGRLGQAEFRPEILRDPDVRALMARVQIEPWDGFPTGPSGVSTAAIVTLRLRSGASFAAEVPAPPGSAGNPLRRPALRAKFVDCAGGRLGSERAGLAFDGLAASRDVTDFPAFLTAMLGDGADDTNHEPRDIRHETRG